MSLILTLTATVCRMRLGMRRALLPVAVVLALVVAPVARLVAAAPCSGPAQMDCCAGMDDEAAPPCNCSLSPVPPAPPAGGRAPAPGVRPRGGPPAGGPPRAPRHGQPRVSCRAARHRLSGILR